MDELETMRESAKLWRDRAKRLEAENDGLKQEVRGLRELAQVLRSKLDDRAESKRAMRAAMLRGEKQGASA